MLRVAWLECQTCLCLTDVSLQLFWVRAGPRWSGAQAKRIREQGLVRARVATQSESARQHVRGGTGREGARSELASGAATGPGGRQPPDPNARKEPSAYSAL